MRVLIVNADDFGHSRAVNAGVVEAHEHGIVTSSSLMVRRAGAEQAARYARTHPELAVGLHVDLGEWSYRDNDGWVALYEVEADAIEAEIEAQLERFRALVGGVPTHLDSHQHVHRREPACSILFRLATELGVSLRHFNPSISYCGEFYGQTDRGEQLPELITTEALLSLISSLPEGSTELCCHPAKGPVPATSYGAERERELAALCDPRVRSAVEAGEIMLCSFRDVGVAEWHE